MTTDPAMARHDVTDPEIDCMTVVRETPAKQWREDGRIMLGPLLERLPELLRRTNPSSGSVSADLDTRVGVLWGSVSTLFNKLQPLQRVADELPGIVARSDSVHNSLQTSQDSTTSLLAAVQQVTATLNTTLSQSMSLMAAALVQNGQLASRVASLEARQVRHFRAVGDLPALAVNTAKSVTCGWVDGVPSPLPSTAAVFLAPPALGAVTPTVTGIGAAGVTVSLKAPMLLSLAPGAVQVVATSWA